MMRSSFAPGFARRREGFIYLMVVFAVIAVAFFVSTISWLNRSYRRQITHTDQKQLSFLVGYSVLSKVLAKVHQAPWTKRFFKDRPFQEFGVKLLGGEYDSHVENTPGKELQIDIYVRVTLANKSELFFWRIVHNDDFFDISNRFQIRFFTVTDPVNFPKNGNSARFASIVDDLLQKRKSNQPKSDLVAGGLQTLNDSREIARVLGARPPELAQAVPPGEFSPNTPLTQTRDEIPTIPPPPPSEDPGSAAGPAPTSVASGTYGSPGLTPSTPTSPGGAAVTGPTASEVESYLDQIRAVIKETRAKIIKSLPPQGRAPFEKIVDGLVAEGEQAASVALNAPTAKARAKAFETIKGIAAQAQKIGDQAVQLANVAKSLPNIPKF